MAAVEGDKGIDGGENPDGERVFGEMDGSAGGGPGEVVYPADQDSEGPVWRVPVQPGSVPELIYELRAAHVRVELLKREMRRVGMEPDDWSELQPTLDLDGRSAAYVGLLRSRGLCRLLTLLGRLPTAVEPE